jgi:hypothetical protein
MVCVTNISNVDNANIPILTQGTDDRKR